MTNKVICAYCNKEANLVTGKEIYPHRPDLYKKKFYQCSPCSAFVGCHPDTDKPLGRLAKADLRKAKIAAHNSFDSLWKKGWKKRGSCYAWLADQLGLPQNECHIGMFDIAMCQKVVSVCQEVGDTDGTRTQ